MIGRQEIERARICCEQVIRDDFTTEAASVLQLMLDILKERLNYFSKNDQCPSDILTAVTTIVWAADRLEVSELTECARQIKLKLGKEFIEHARTNYYKEHVNPRVMEKLDPAPPSGQLVEDYMVRIAEANGIKYVFRP